MFCVRSINRLYIDGYFLFGTFTYISGFRIFFLVWFHSFSRRYLVVVYIVFLAILFWFFRLFVLSRFLYSISISIFTFSVQFIWLYHPFKFLWGDYYIQLIFRMFIFWSFLIEIRFESPFFLRFFIFQLILALLFRVFCHAVHFYFQRSFSFLQFQCSLVRFYSRRFWFLFFFLRGYFDDFIIISPGLYSSYWFKVFLCLGLMFDSLIEFTS